MKIELKISIIAFMLFFIWKTEVINAQKQDSYLVNNESNIMQSLKTDERSNHKIFSKFDSLTISGSIKNSTESGIEGVRIVMSNLPNSTTTDTSGFYCISIPSGWSGYLAPFKDDYDFLPSSCFYRNVLYDISGQDINGYGPYEAPAPPTDLILFFYNSLNMELRWTDNSSFEHGFIIISKDTIYISQNDTQAFIDYDRSLPETVKVASYNFYGKSDYAYADLFDIAIGIGPPLIVILQRPNNLNAFTRSNKSILLTWKDNSDFESLVSQY